MNYLEKANYYHEELYLKSKKKEWKKAEEMFLVSKI